MLGCARRTPGSLSRLAGVQAVDAGKCSSWVHAAGRSLFGFARDDAPREPQVPLRPAVRSYEGSKWQDEYSWLEAGGAAVQQALRQERRHADEWLQRCAPLAGRLRDEMLELLPPTQVSTPERVGGHDYFVRQLPGRPHPCFVRRPAPGGGWPAGEEEVVLDVNELAAVHGEYVQVGQMKLSRCGQRVAFTLDAGDGSEAFGAFTRELGGGTPRHLSRLGGVVSLEWAADGRRLLATQPNAMGRPWRVVGCDAAAGAAGGAPWPVFQEGDERYFVELGRTKDWSFLTLNCNSKAASEVHLLPAGLPAAQPGAAGGGGALGGGVLAPPRLVQARTQGLEYFVEHCEGQLYILSNARGASNYAVFRVPATAPHLGQEHWRLVVGEGEAGGAIEDVDATRGCLLLYLRHAGRQQVAALPLRRGLPLGDAPRQGTAAGQRLRLAPLPEWALSVGPGANADFESSRLRLLLSSPVHPEAAHDWHMEGDWRLVAAGQGEEQQQEAQPRVQPRARAARDEPQTEQQAGRQAGQQARAGRRPAPGVPVTQQHEALAPELAWQRLWATSGDGTALPLTVAYARGSAPPAGPRPCLLVVYGAYGHSLPTDYAPERLPLLRRGWVVALAHVRGGGELGRAWHAAGRGAAKAASLADLEASLDYLMATGWTAPGRVALEAHSAGGLTAAALLNRRPAVLGAALLEAPFVDVLSTMCQPELPLTVHEYEEWGDPRQPQQLEQIRALCPYQNVRPQHYPPTLLTCSQADLRVPYWGPLKHAARLRAAVAAVEQGAGEQAASGGRRGGPILLLPDGQAGHFVHERDLLSTKAAQYAFLLAAVEGTLRPLSSH